MLTSILILAVIFWLFYTKFFGAEYYPTRKKIMKRMLEFATLRDDDVVYDLGCGDARLVVASAKYVSKSVGIEIDPLRFIVSWLNVKLHRLKNARIVYGNFFNFKLSEASVIFLFLRQETNDKLKSKLKEELKPRTRIVSHHWKFTGWKPVKQDKKLKVYLYVIK